MSHFLNLCESPIEKRLLLCLLAYFETKLDNGYKIGYEYDPLEDEEINGSTKSRPTAKVLNYLSTPDFIIINHPVFEWKIYPQKNIQIDDKQYRVDFLIEIKKLNNEIKHVCIECDGHTFHHRNFDQINRDNSRDIDLASKGYVVFHFSSSQIDDFNFDRTVESIVSKINGYAYHDGIRKERQMAIEVLPSLIDEYAISMGLSEEEKKELFDQLRSQLNSNQ